MTLGDLNLLASVRLGLAKPFADPITVAGVEMSRSTARAMERELSRLDLAHRRKNTHPAAFQEPTVASGFKAEVPEGTSGEQDAGMSTSAANTSEWRHRFFEEAA